MGNSNKNAVGCGQCKIHSICGGLDQLTTDGCYSYCLSECVTDTCDLTCSNNTKFYPGRLAEIDNKFDYVRTSLLAPRLHLPHYIASVPNASGRTRNLNRSVVAVPFRSIASFRNKRINIKYRSSNEMKLALKISQRSRVIISCITHDDEIERAWTDIKYGKLSDDIAQLNPAAIIAPNFSFFTDVPREHTLYNRRRITITAELLSKSGCPVIVHLSTLQSNDWLYWSMLLEDNPQINLVAKEFQTGRRKLTSGRSVINGLARLQDKINRPLHPIAIAGRQFTPELRANFDNFSIMDSRPFFLTHYRQKLSINKGGNYSTKFQPMPVGAPVDNLFKNNLRVYENRVLYDAE